MLCRQNGIATAAYPCNARHSTISTDSMDLQRFMFLSISHSIWLFQMFRTRQGAKVPLLRTQVGDFSIRALPGCDCLCHC